MFGGQVVNTTTREQVHDALVFFKDLWVNPKLSKHIETMGQFLTLSTDKAREGAWTNVAPSQPIWHLSEPCLQYTLIVANKGTVNEKITRRKTGAKGNYFLQVFTSFYKYHRASII